MRLRKQPLIADVRSAEIKVLNFVFITKMEEFPTAIVMGMIHIRQKVEIKI